MNRQAFAVIAALVAAFVAANQASAHVIAIGYTPGANVGEVNLWLGSYHDHGGGDGPDIEGSARLQGDAPSTYDTTTPFSYGEGVLGYSSGAAPPPAGLVLGTNLFTSANYGGTTTDQSTLDGVYSWEAATISGLSAGGYTFTYVPIVNPSAHWAPWSDLQSVHLTLTSGDTGGGGANPGVPEPTSLLVLGGLSLMFGLAGRRRRRRAA